MSLERSIFFLRANWLLIAAGIWLAIAVVLISHFRFYYGVAWPNAVKWGTGDGFIWVLLLGLFAHISQRHWRSFQPMHGSGLFLVLSVMGGVLLHPTISTLLFWAIDGSISRPFHEDVVHLAMKRLPQGILAGLAIGFAGVFISRSRARRQQATPAKSQAPASRTHYAPWVVLKDSSGVRRIPIGDIRYLEAAGNYVALHTHDGEHLKRTTLKAMEEMLDSRQFRRISRKHIVNLDRIQSIRSTEPKGGVVTLNDDTSLTTSRRYKAALQNAVARPRQSDRDARSKRQSE